MVQALRPIKYLTYFLFIFSFSLGTAFSQDDPPSRVLRLNYYNGNVSMEPAGVDDWAPAAINRPFTTGDYLYTDQSSVAELHTDVAAVRLGEYSNLGVLNLTDSVVQLKLTQGDLYVRMHDLYPNDVFEVDTPNAALTLLRAGVYRIHVDPNQNTTFVVARSGQAEVTGGGQAFMLNPGSSATLSGTDQLAYDVQEAPAPDNFDQWSSNRDAHWAHARSAQYVPPTMIGSEDLDDNGGWADSPQYGHVWYPNTVPGGWAPYHNGHWAWIAPWGWTWVDDAPWGFAPFHYGRWVYDDDRWGWTPGPVLVAGPVIRPCYAPAMVAWFGGEHWGVSLSIGGGPSVGWVPLGYGEVYTPSYNVSRNYFRQVNVSNTRIVNTTNITNVYNNVYVNKTVYNQTFINTRAPNAVAAMPQSGFASGRSVAQNATFLRPEQASHIQYAQASIVAPPVAPTRQAFAPSLGRPVVKPSAQLMARQVVAKNTPPPPPASFAAQQNYLQQHAGQINNAAAMLRQVGPRTPTAVAGIRQAPAARPVLVQPGQRVGSVPPVRLAQNTAATQPAQTAAPRQQQHGVPPSSQAQRNNDRQVSRPEVVPSQRPNPGMAYPPAQGQIQRNNDRQVSRPDVAPAQRPNFGTPYPPVQSQTQRNNDRQVIRPDVVPPQRPNPGMTYPPAQGQIQRNNDRQVIRPDVAPPQRPNPGIGYPPVQSQVPRNNDRQVVRPDVAPQQRPNPGISYPPVQSQVPRNNDRQITRPDVAPPQRPNPEISYPPVQSQVPRNNDRQVARPDVAPPQRPNNDQTRPAEPHGTPPPNQKEKH